MHEDQRALSKLMDFTQVISIFLLLLNIYWFCYAVFQDNGWTVPFIDNVLKKLNKGSGLFQESIYSKLACILFLAISCLGTKGVKSETITGKKIRIYFVLGAFLFFANDLFLNLFNRLTLNAFLYISTLTVGYLMLLKSGNYLTRLFNHDLMKDIFNEENESFPQEEAFMQNEYSVNLPTEYQLKGKIRKGWINVVNPFRATGVTGTPGSGKSFAVINQFIKQHIQKGFAMYIYDYKFDDLSRIAYNTLLKNYDKYQVKPSFYVINFDNPAKSHRCNPLLPSMMSDIIDAYESSYTIMLNLNKKWIEKQGEFFVESPINFLAAIIWFLRLYDNGKYCTFPHAIEFLSRKYEEIFPILGSYPEIENYVKPFVSAFEGGAMEQLEGQIASARIPLSRLASPQLYWVMSGNDFTLDLNNPEAPKVLCVGNNPDRQAIYGAALGLYNARIIKLINKKHKLKSSVIIDELPTIYFKGLDNLIATARSNKVSTLLGFQDFSQLERDYGRAEATVIKNTIGNIFSGQVVGDSAKQLSERFGRILQKRQSISVSRDSTSSSTSTQLDSMIPASKIANLSQGMFVGAVADNMGEEIGQKVFHATIKIDVKGVKEEESNYQEIPVITNFTDSAGVNRMDEIIQNNYLQIKADIENLIKAELIRINTVVKAPVAK
ncbi:conjugal transfer protein TraG [Adhaeribacter aerolatus]|uniref:Conjugal transfer protein TraG n=1 Tax=Adhaeribacter aerolatus TaxID=670289 RepID=A0A512B0L3_9BACT|nr:conjugal transfer protein MobC [Adhaeribacter aerolatus]GEO05508.1 conjugal transfer protein TraG [Adhaeribacter aerolatus]